MICQWLSFTIYLPDLQEWLSENIPESDGIVSNEDSFEIIEREPFSPEQINWVQEHINSLTPITEIDKINEVDQLKLSLLNCRMALAYKSFETLEVFERKIILGIELTEEEKSGLITAYGN